MTTGPGPYFHSRAVIEACKPFERLRDFPATVRLESDKLDEVRQKWGKYFE
jgi:hypothetical protein